MPALMSPCAVMSPVTSTSGDVMWTLVAAMISIVPPWRRYTLIAGAIVDHRLSRQQIARARGRIVRGGRNAGRAIAGGEGEHCGRADRRARGIAEMIGDRDAVAHFELVDLDLHGLDSRRCRRCAGSRRCRTCSAPCGRRAPSAISCEPPPLASWRAAAPPRSALPTCQSKGCNADGSTLKASFGISISSASVPWCSSRTNETWPMIHGLSGVTFSCGR